MKKLRVGIVGCGGIANNKHMPALAAIKEVELVAFCDIVAERAERAKEEYGTADAKAYTDYKELISDKTIDVVHVCTPNKSHSFITIDSLESGKHVMCEKPMAKTYEEGKAMVEAAKRTGKKLTIGYQFRFRPDSQYVYELCKEKALGKVYYAKAHAIRRRAVPTWGVFLNEDEQGGGPLIDIGTHSLDLSLWLMDNYKPLYVVGNTYRELADTENAANIFGPWNPKEFNVEDSAFGFVTMEDGSTILLESAWALNSLEVNESMCSLHGTKGGADMRGGLTVHGERFGKLYDTKVDLSAGGVAFFEGQSQEAHMIEARQWIDAVLNDKEPLVKPEQALVVTQILEAIYESSKTKKPVFFN